MTAEQPSRTPRQRSVLPWLIAAGALVVYLVTLNRWITPANGALVMHAAGWNHALPYHQPLLHLLTMPFQWLPASWIPLALNGLNAVLAAAVLGLLAHSVMLLPHDRTRHQRMRERSHGALLSLPCAWVPPVLAAVACGLELTFWRNAVSATGEMLDLLIFASLIYFVLRFRLTRNDRWLFALSALYGVAMANNYALIGYLPAFIIAFIWLKGLRIFDTRFLVTSLLLGLAGSLFYLVMPLVHVFSDLSDLTFWQALKANLVFEKGIPHAFLFQLERYHILVLCLTSVIPLALIGVRWKSNVGDTNALSVMLRDLMFHGICLFYLALCIMVVFNPRYSPFEWTRRELGVPIPFLSFYYLGALTIGYCAGYLLLVFGKAPTAGPKLTPSALGQAINFAVQGLIWVALLAVPAGLVYVNFKPIHDENSPLYSNYAQLLAKSLPATRGVALCDDPQRFLLLAGELARTGRGDQWLLLDTRMLNSAAYNRDLKHRHPDLWPALPDPHPPSGQVDQGWLVATLATTATSLPVYYLHPSFGYYFEVFYPQPEGLAYRLVRYERESLVAPVLTASQIAAGQKFWADIEQPILQPVIEGGRQTNLAARALGSLYSKSLNWWGAQLQTAGQLEAAAKSFQQALQLNPDNVVAQVNGDFNAQLQKGGTKATKLPKTVEDKFGKYRSWEQVMGDNGPFDEPRFCFEAGQVFFRGNLIRQAGQQFLRSIALRPDELNPRLLLTQLYLLAGRPTNALVQIQEIRAKPDLFDLTRSNRLELSRLEIAARLSNKETNTAERLIQDAYNQGRKDPATLIMLMQARLAQDRTEDGLKLNEEVLQLQPDDPELLLNRTALLIQLSRWPEAIPILDQLLVKDSKNDKARFNRAIANLKAANYAAAEADYKVLTDLYPNFYSLHFGLGEAAYQLKKRELALKYYRLYLKNAPPGTPEAQQVEARVKELEGGK